jgi:hypothetical protein
MSNQQCRAAYEQDTMGTIHQNEIHNLVATGFIPGRDSKETGTINCLDI